MQQLSPKKYIETKARTLPIHKCLVNKGWQDAGMATVVVMRQHVNGNVTGADFLVDLKCLGVKDVHWFFNENEKSMMEKFSIGGFMQPADYATAHNIVYAGYEFAHEFGIQPHKDFAVARFILEEDTDDIPLIDIETGDNGIPHLIEYQPGQYADALAKLKKNAGEGNYHYTTALAGGTGSSGADDVERMMNQ